MIPKKQIVSPQKENTALKSEKVNEEKSLGVSSTDLAFQQAALSHDTTLTAWLRTAISLMSFGFTIYKFLGIKCHKSGPIPIAHSQTWSAYDLLWIIVATGGTKRGIERLLKS